MFYTPPKIHAPLSLSDLAARIGGISDQTQLVLDKFGFQPPALLHRRMTMKIKQVCERTGLTDRAIRYYIEEGLVFPAYTENYMGRRAYDFTDGDVTALTHVATLRKFGFTVEEIRRILTDPQESIAIVGDVRARKEETLRQEGANLDALSRLEEERAYTVAELAEKLTVSHIENAKKNMLEGRMLHG